MPRFLVESYAAASPAALEELGRRARRAAELTPGVRHLRTTFLPGDETVLHLFEAPTADAVGQAGRLAALPVDRIVEAIEGSVEPLEEG